MDWCQGEMNFLWGLGGKNARNYIGLQISVIVFGALVPVAEAAALPRWLPALLGAAAAIAASANATFRFREEWVRQSVTANSLNSEFLSFNARLGDDYNSSIPEEERLATFHKKVGSIVMEQTDQWRNDSSVQSSRPAPPPAKK